MKISIITVVYNGAKTIRTCIDSVLKQDYHDLEYIIIDGGSTDGTQEVIRSYGSRIQKFVSEKDHGIYDAMNKGIKIATGELIGIINADDFYVTETVLTEAANAVEQLNADACYADLEYVDSENTGLVKRKWKSGSYQKGAFLNGWMPPHPTFFIKKSLYERYGVFRLDLGSAADYELMLRMIHKYKASMAYVPKVWIRMRTGGVSNSNFKNRLKANKNDRKAWIINDLNPKFYTLLLKPLRKIFQFF
ncbi:hypothetical protein DYBT9275_02043 [Dyadobacter sp. CECT 9275]|uniref:Glycosyltransferase 2-like domain-containing protein n=1 Tax=Dyadobacter helix TaxID=2822344 RepID=A0A916NBZ2_9BACT|nr:glycosyltransferase family 2 protein [Dyadobacter sp. CECT 9275]CAG4998636.1 hypothetical protein DYBT9275_02043 [Dyadobacter sp. CECT 9275]